jgi:hypothetical protein
MARKRFTPPCPICGQPCKYNCGRRWNKTCGHRPCFLELRRRQSVGQIPTAANAAIRRQRDDRMQAALRLAIDGPVTARDRAVWAVAFKYAYLKGYHAGRRFVTRTQVAA